MRAKRSPVWTTRSGSPAVSAPGRAAPRGHQACRAFALRSILDQPGTSVVIPGARSHDQVLGNVCAAELPSLDAATLDAVRAVYDELISSSVADRW